MNYESKVFFVKTSKPRPEFGLVADFLWGKNANIDSAGNSSNPSDPNWTELTLEHREKLNERIDVDPVMDNPLVLKVKSDKPNLAARVAFYLAYVTDGEVSDKLNGEYVNPKIFRDALGEFDVDDALRRVEN